MALIPLATVMAGIETAAATAVILLVRLLQDPGAEPLPLLGFLHAGAHGATDVVVRAVALLIALYVVRAVVVGAVLYARHAVTSASAAGLGERLVAAYLGAPYAFHLRRDSAQLMRKATDSVDVAIRIFLSSSVSLATEILIVAGIVSILAITTPFATVAVMTGLVAVLALVLRRTRPLLARWGHDVQREHEASIRALQQALGAVKEVKATGSERFFHDAYASHQHALWATRRREAVLADLVRIAVESGCVVGLLLVVLIATLVRGAGAEAMPVLAVYAYAGFRVIPAANRILLALGLMSFGRAAVRDLHADLELVTPSAARSPALPRRISFTDRIVLDGVSYAYGDERGFVLRDIDLTIHRGESIAIVGRSGVGKSTLIDVLLGLLEPTSGRVLVDGVGIRDALPAWQAKVGYVPHPPFLVDDTLRRNIAFGVDEEDIDHGRMEAAVYTARLGEFVAALPDGLQTAVGERGVRLSSGQRQRVAIARALYRDPQVVVLDEATTGLDPQTEREVAEAIDALRGSRTLIVVAHRLAIVRRCDRLVLLAGGRIGAMGSYEELMADSPEFRALADLPA
jgi:ATP-binding cassette subfamily C protein